MVVEGSGDSVTRLPKDSHLAIQWWRTAAPGLSAHRHWPGQEWHGIAVVAPSSHVETDTTSDRAQPAVFLP